ncbi:uncharacterized protein LOC133186491 [Saccostrea echinata]|uniref:uncharacterized protein LOC133186491 n=1 Tax=Saccostrea echinata TaxID=191078 RepID=UPI002A811170|nr:uncharacterized protein LOC133186491 [Saccostrea echinata]
MVIYVALGFTLLFQVVTAKFYCEKTWQANQDNGLCYKFFLETQTWKQARQICTKHSGFLVSVTNEKEQNFIVEDILKSNQTWSVWVGGHSLYYNGWHWDNYRRKFNFTRWATGRPVSPPRCIAMVGVVEFNWSDQACADVRPFICEKPAHALHCDGRANVVQLEPDKLTSVNFPPFYDPHQPFKYPPYAKNLTCLWNIVPPTGYRLVMEFDLFCNDDLRAYQGGSSLDDVTCQVRSGNFVVNTTLILSFTTNYFTRPRSEQGFQFRMFATNTKESACDPAGVPLVASSQEQSITSPGFPLQRSSSCVWTLVSPVKGSSIYIQFRYRYITDGAALRIQNDVFAGSSMLEDSRILAYPEEKIVLNYTSPGTFSGHHGFSLIFFTDNKNMELCTQKDVQRNLSEYGIPIPEEQFMIFSVKASKHIQIELHSAGGENYLITFYQDPPEIVGTYSCLKTALLDKCLETYTSKTLDSGFFVDFWVSWSDTLKIGRGRIRGDDIIMEYRIYNPLKVDFLSIRTINGTGTWKFYGSAVITDFVEICHTSGTALKQLSDHNLPVPGNNYITFSVKMCERAMIRFKATNGSYMRIWLNARSLKGDGYISCITHDMHSNNTYSCISDAYLGSVLNCNEFSDFWITWGRNTNLRVGKGKIFGNNTMFSTVTALIPAENSFSFGSESRDNTYISSVWRFDKPPTTPEIINVTKSEVAPSSLGVEGTILTMSVDINVRFGFEVKWFRNGTYVTQSPGRFSIRQTLLEVMKCSLTIVELKLRDEANWTVIVSNQHSEATASFDIKVKPGINLEISPHYRMAVQRGSTLELVCNITNLQDLEGLPIDISLLTWYKNGVRLIQEIAKLTMTTSRSSSLLRILSVDPNDQGTYSCNHEIYRVSRVINTTVDIYNKGATVCPSSKDIYGILWPTVIPGSLTHSDCPEGQQGNASRFCDYNGNWKKTSVSYCVDAEFSNTLNELQVLEDDGVLDKMYIEQTFESSLKKTENLTASKTEISSANLLSSINIINTVLRVATQSNASVPQKNVYSIVDHVASADNRESWKLVDEETHSGPESVLETMDWTNSLLMKELKSEEFRGENVVVNISEVSLQEAELRFLENESFIVLPKQEGQKQVTKYSAVLYKTMSQFLPSKTNISGSGTDRVINSMVLALTLEQTSRGLSPPIELTFQHNREVRVVEGEADCVYWDYTLFDNAGGWSTEGCFMNSTENGVTVCLCNHTTNFAVLMRPYTPEKEDSVLVIISIVGCVISMLFGVLTITVYAILWKQIKSDQNVLIICLCVSLFLAYLILLAGVDNAQNEAACVVVTLFLHFFLLLTFFLMFGVGMFFFMNVTVLFYAMGIANKFNSRSRLKWILGLATCIPLVIVLITLGSCWDTQYHAEAFCWLSVSSGAIYAFIVPVILIFLLNVCIIVSLLRVMFLTTKMKKAEFKEKARNALRSVCTLVPVLGITWIFGIFAINEDLVAFQYIFTIANSIQGLLIFITHVLLNRKIRKALQAKYPFLKGKRDKSAYKEKDHRVVSSTASENSTSNTQTMALVPAGYTECKNPDIVAENDIQIETKETHSKTFNENKVFENHFYVSSLETRIEGGKILTQTETKKHSQTEQKVKMFESKFSSSNGLTEKSRQEEIKWGGGAVSIQSQAHSEGYEEVRLSREVRVRQTKMTQLTVGNSTLQNKIHFIKKDDGEYDA